ncbi:hypothetical protein JTB14_021459 [Gonioctena quinquepunctata]|nr:hypothetical protein JTB14_021459 [Gonioctena quinquepunctata]
MSATCNDNIITNLDIEQYNTSVLDSCSSDRFSQLMYSDFALEQRENFIYNRNIRSSLEDLRHTLECPPAEDRMERFACPTPDRQGRYHCIDDHVLCDGFVDCPSGEDEDRQACMFYKTTKAHLDVLADALLRWARGR